jgi:Fe-S oxidoreductase
MSRSKLEGLTNTHPHKYIVLKRRGKKDNVRAMRVSLFIPCLVDQFYPEVGVNTVRILKKAGAEVHYPDKQICCGQPFFNSGHWKKAIPLAENTIRAFGSAEIVVAPSGSCVNMLRHSYAELFRDHPNWLERAKALSSKPCGGPGSQIRGKGYLSRFLPGSAWPGDIFGAEKTPATGERA